MTGEGSAGTPVEIELHPGFLICRHGYELRRLSAERAEKGWLVWGHYGCVECARVAFELCAERPTDALVAARRFKVQSRST